MVGRKRHSIIQGMQNAWNVIKPIIMVLVKYIWESIKGVIDGVITTFQGLIEFFTGIFTGDWRKALGGLAKIFFGVFQTIWNFTNLTFFGGIKKLLINFSIKGAKLIKVFSVDAIKSFKDIWKKVGKS